MPVLIDGNNLLFAARDHDPERPPSRSMLCLRLSEWSKRTGEKVSVVFDGPTPSKSIIKQTAAPGVTVRYSGGGISADSVLADMITENSAARLLLVVSTDREVAAAARRRRAKTMRSDDFWAAVQRDLARPVRVPLEPAEKRSGLPPTDAERWIHELGLDGEHPNSQ